MAEIGALKGVTVTICGIKCIDLTEEVIRVLGVFFSYDKICSCKTTLEKTILNIEKILKMWRQRNLTLEGKIIIFKTLTLSKITFLAQVLEIPNQIIDTSQQIRKDFLWNSSSPKVKHETICKDFQYGGLKNVDIKSKIITMPLG